MSPDKAAVILPVQASEEIKLLKNCIERLELDAVKHRAERALLVEALKCILEMSVHDEVYRAHAYARNALAKVGEKP